MRILSFWEFRSSREDARMNEFRAGMSCLSAGWKWLSFAVLNVARCLRMTFL